VRGDRRGTEFALQRFLINQLDERLAETGRRSTGLFEFGPPPPPGMGPMPGFRILPVIGDASSFARSTARTRVPQRSRAGGAHRRRGDIARHAGQCRCHHRRRHRAEISTTAAQQLAHVPPDHRPTTVELDGLGRYRVLAMHARGPGETIVTGLPTSDVDDTLLTVLVIFGVVGRSR